MKDYRVTKFLVACGIASVLLVGCGSDNDNNGPSLSKITTDEEAAAASVAVQSVLSGSFDPDFAPKFKSPRVASLLATSHSAKVKAIKAQKAKFAAKAASFAPIVGEVVPCEGGGSFTVTAYSSEFNSWSQAYTYNNCVENLSDFETLKTNGKYSVSWVYNPDTGFATWIYKAGNMDGVATLASDYSRTYTSGDYTSVEVEDMNEEYVSYEDYITDFTNEDYNGFTRGQMTVTEGDSAGKITVNTSESGSESWVAATNTYTDKYKFSGSITASFVVDEETTAASFSANITSTYVEGLESETDSPNGTMTINLTMPAAEGIDCSMVSGTYQIETVEALSFPYSDESDYPSAGELLINNNTTVVYSGPGNVTVTLEGGEPVEYVIDDLLYDLSLSCPLVLGMPENNDGPV